MTLKDYQPFWNAVCPLMCQKMEQLTTDLRARLPAGLKVTDPSIQIDTDEFKVGADIVSPDGTVVIGMDFVLLDGDMQGAEGLGIALTLTGHNALRAGGYYPNAYTEEAFTYDREALKSRVLALPVQDMVTHIIDEGLTDETLLRELAEDGVTI